MITIKFKKIFIPLASLVILGVILWFLFVPEFKRNTTIGEHYLYIDTGKFIKQRYTVKNNEPANIVIPEGKKFSLYLPYNETITSKWIVSNDSFELKEEYIKKSRTPIYDRNKEGTSYSRQVFVFENLEGASGTLEFIYKKIDDNVDLNDNKNTNKIILNITTE